MVEFGEWLCEEVLKHVTHRQCVFSIPKRFRVNSMTNRLLLARLFHCAWKILSVYLKIGFQDDYAVPMGVIAVQALGDFNKVIVFYY